MASDRRATTLRLGLVAVVAIGVAVAYLTGVFDRIGDPAKLAAELVALGAWGYVAFLVAYTLLQPFGVPGTVFVVAAPLIWPWPIAFALNMAGTMSASVVGFSFARFVARDWVARRIPARLKKYENALERRGFVTVATLRFVFWMPQALHAFLGVSKVRFWTHFWGSFAGYLVPLFFVSFFGERLFTWMRTLPASAWIATGAALVGLGLGVWSIRRARARRARAVSEAVRDCS